MLYSNIIENVKVRVYSNVMVSVAYSDVIVSVRSNISNDIS